MTDQETKILEPIRRAFPAEKSKAWHYKIHPYYTKQPSNVVAEYIKHFSPEGGLVVDPFCGSGVTAIEALTNRRRTICTDLDPLAVFITRQTCIAPVDLDAYWEAYHQIERKMKPTMEFVRKASPKELEEYELKEWYPKGIKLPSNADRGYVEDLFGRAQIISLAHLHSQIMRVKDEKIRQLLRFTFSGILARASITYGVDSKQAGGGDSAIFKVYRYWVPPSPDYRDIWGLFSTRARLVANAKKESTALFGDFFKEGDTFRVFNDSAENLLKYTGKDTVDYIYTDPPYGAHISYLDLSTMWHAWLGFEVPPERRAREAIEGGELQFDQNHYLGVLQKSFEQMFHVLKDDAWLSLVFHHKQTKLWYSIRDMLRYIGFKYVNCVAQPLSKQTFHKVKNPLRVLGESLILNFQKSSTRKIMEPIPLPMANVINNAAERVIVREAGATTEEIMRDVVPELFEAGLMVDAASKSMNDILAMLEQDFELGMDNLWHLKTGHRIGYFIPPRERIRYYVVTYLRKGKASFDNIITTVLPLLINGHQPTKEDIADVLKEVAISNDNVNWQLKDPTQQIVQTVLPLSVPDMPEEIPDMPAGTPHNEKIFRLALICIKAGLVPFIGKQERNDTMFASIKPLTSLNIKTEPGQMKRIEQIDIIWATPDGKPVWAFEVEEHTTVLSALERFVALLSAVPDIGMNHQLTIVAPKTRRRKVQQELTTSSYIGHPLYMENKVSYLFYDALESAFNKFLRKRDVGINEFHLYCNTPNIEQRETKGNASLL